VTRSPYRVVVWGPGALGSLLLREVLDRPELDLVGVLAYSDAKKGVDVGTFLGREPVGVAMTTDKDDIHALEADVVLVCPQATAGSDLGSPITDDVLALLRGGKSVITASGYHYPPFHSNGIGEVLTAACLEGGSSIHATGVNPGWLSERVVTTLTAACSRIDSITVQEVGVGSTVDSADMMQMIGWGQLPPPMELIVEMAARYYGESITHACALLGREVERIETGFDYVLAERDYDLGGFTVPAGTMGSVQHTFTAIVDGRPFFRLEEHFICHPDVSPVPLPSKDHWTVLIEGEPTSIRTTIEMAPSFSREVAGDGPPIAYWATAMPMLQAIPVVVDAEPGIVYPTVFTTAVPDLRQLARSR
jgi:4-hydroxy-tetrahydrodipicolinate reductase